MVRVFSFGGTRPVIRMTRIFHIPFLMTPSASRFPLSSAEASKGFQTRLCRAHAQSRPLYFNPCYCVNILWVLTLVIKSMFLKLVLENGPTSGSKIAKFQCLLSRQKLHALLVYNFVARWLLAIDNKVPPEPNCQKSECDSDDNVDPYICGDFGCSVRTRPVEEGHREN